MKYGRTFAWMGDRRTPHGVRGLKYVGEETVGVLAYVAPLTGCVD